MKKKPTAGSCARTIRATILSIILLCSVTATANNSTLTLPGELHLDPYTRHLKVMDKFYRKFNPDMPRKDVEALCWATWRGCGGDPQAALWLSMIQALERNFKPETDITMKVQGYSGQYWYTLITAAQDHGMKRPKVGWRKYFLKHPYEAEYHTARWFKERWYDIHGPWETLAIWHRGSNWRDSDKDLEDVKSYRSDIVTIYNKYYLPIAHEIFIFPPKIPITSYSQQNKLGFICLLTSNR